MGIAYDIAMEKVKEMEETLKNKNEISISLAELLLELINKNISVSVATGYAILACIQEYFKNKGYDVEREKGKLIIKKSVLVKA
mgnify:CR=1 FL=1